MPHCTAEKRGGNTLRSTHAQHRTSFADIRMASRYRGNESPRRTAAPAIPRRANVLRRCAILPRETYRQIIYRSARGAKTFRAEFPVPVFRGPGSGVGLP